MTPEERFYEAANACCEKGHGGRYPGGRSRRVICNDCASEALRAAQNEAIERCFNRVLEGSKYFRKLNPKVKLIVFDGLEEIASDIRALKEEG